VKFVDFVIIDTWHNVPSYFPLQINKYGFVRNSQTGNILKPQIKTFVSGDRRSVVYYGRNGKKVSANVHRLLGLTFLERPIEKNLVCHRDGNSINNRLDNLYWGNSKDNTEDDYRNGALKRGILEVNRKLDRWDVFEIKALQYAGVSQSRIGPLFGISPKTVSKLMRGQRGTVWLEKAPI